MSKEAMKLALEALEDTLSDDPYPYSLESKAITALREALAKPDFWEGYVPEPVKPAQQCWKCGDMDAAFQDKCDVPACGMKEQPAQQCKWPTCQSEEYQQALAEQIKRELVGEQPAQQEPVACIEHDDETAEPCPSCGKPLQSASGGGVVCSGRCGYWFCF